MFVVTEGHSLPPSSKSDLQVVLGGNNEAPSRPDQTGSSEGTVLGEGQLLGGTGKVRDTSEDERPLHDGGPEVDGLEANGAVPHAREPRLLGLGGGALPSATGVGALGLESSSVCAKCRLAESRPGGAEQARGSVHCRLLLSRESDSLRRVEEEGRGSWR